MRNLMFRFLGDATNFSGASSQVQEGLSSMKRQATIAGAAISATITALGTAAIYSAGRFEQTTIAFETMLGSAGETKKLLSDLTDFAALTPFEMPEIQAAARGLVQFGERGDELMESLNILGNAASGTSTNFGELALIFNQVRGVGKLLTEDFRQMSTRGVITLKDIADHFDVTTEAAQGMLSGGKISFDDLRNILKGLSEDGGRFAGLMEKQSKSFLGLVSTIKDAVGIELRKVGTLLLPFAKQAAQAFLTVIETLAKTPKSVKVAVVALLAAVPAFGAVAAAAGIAVLAIGSLITALTTIGGLIAAVFTPATLIIVGVTAAIVGVGAAVAYAAYQSGLLFAAFEQGKVILKEVWQVVEQTFGGMSDALQVDDWKLAADIGWAGIKLAFFTGLEQVSLALARLVPSILKTFKILFVDMALAAAEGMFAVAKIIANPFKATDYTKKMVDAFSNIGNSDGGLGGYFKNQRIKAQKELDALTESASKAAEEAAAAAKKAEGGDPAKSNEEKEKGVQLTKEEIATQLRLKQALEQVRSEIMAQAGISGPGAIKDPRLQAAQKYLAMIRKSKEEQQKAKDQLKSYQDELAQSAKSLKDSLQEPWEKAADKLGKYRVMLSKGLITQGEFKEAVAKVGKEFITTNESAKALHEYLAGTRNFNSTMEGLSVGQLTDTNTAGMKSAIAGSKVVQDNMNAEEMVLKEKAKPIESKGVPKGAEGHVKTLTDAIAGVTAAIEGQTQPQPVESIGA